MLKSIWYYKPEPYISILVEQEGQLIYAIFSIRPITGMFIILKMPAPLLVTSNAADWGVVTRRTPKNILGDIEYKNLKKIDQLYQL